MTTTINPKTRLTATRREMIKARLKQDCNRRTFGIANAAKWFGSNMAGLKRAVRELQAEGFSVEWTTERLIIVR